MTAPAPRCGECGGNLVGHVCTECGTRHNPPPAPALTIIVARDRHQARATADAISRDPRDPYLRLITSAEEARRLHGYRFRPDVDRLIVVGYPERLGDGVYVRSVLREIGAR